MSSRSNAVATVRAVYAGTLVAVTVAAVAAQAVTVAVPTVGAIEHATPLAAALHQAVSIALQIALPAAVELLGYPTGVGVITATPRSEYGHGYDDGCHDQDRH